MTTGSGTAQRALSRRTLLGAGLAAGVSLGALGVAGCTGPAPPPRLVIAGGVQPGVYISLARTLAALWQERLGPATSTEVLTTAGSTQNMQLLVSGAATVAISQVDVAADVAAGVTGATEPLALARLYDDVTHVVVRRDSRYRSLDDLRGARVSIGPAGSGYQPIALRLLDVAGIGTAGLGEQAGLGLPDAVEALRGGRIDAFFWSGGVPTDGIRELADELPIRLLDLGAVLDRMRERFPVYSVGTVPANTYGLPGPVSCLSVRNVLLATAGMPDTTARSLIDAAFAGQPRLAQASPAAVTVDSRSAIGTQPIALHPGAVEFYRSTKGY
ncbi:C4-dicarboxylate ABC transporter substrate-binding protein [Pseudonocardia sp. EC080610-09]|uniref:TAXI family TRAP transporter solute-binding subunit n=1 Tax=unclassified Pseudonocardia TaxID=2619320 RepID=UPI0006CB4629|nr:MULTISPECIES: TAXI family TRAP transporter solute-binding subunit [unclassified Pseudonocardia]ALE74411.1 C4-dicarboxylate ABC transporter substrate-binding protein [Pseudonocardia sp. EC080625-04]ALL77824.1 C4-dicarboxylate ABC transporter substrate-binding protein [Pseudonocardia sp. EC080610-09]ALL80740.1 C4-dicarboxylate ABC transporter substrate-binding protein [Pseudonocardia sp. EC080619-01]